MIASVAGGLHSCLSSKVFGILWAIRRRSSGWPRSSIPRESPDRPSTGTSCESIDCAMGTEVDRNNTQPIKTRMNVPARRRISRSSIEHGREDAV